MYSLLKTTLILFVFLIALDNACKSQDFFKDYSRYVRNITPKDQKQSYLKSLNVMKRAFDEYKEKSNSSILARDTIFIVQVSYPLSFRGKVVVWNRSKSLAYNYSFNMLLKPSQIGKYGWNEPIEPFKVDTNASKEIDKYTPEFKKWVETADTISYGKDGLGGNIDAPAKQFVVAIKTQKHWIFISSKITQNNIYKYEKY